MLVRATIATVLILFKNRKIKVTKTGFGMVGVLPTAINSTSFAVLPHELVLKNIGIVAISVLKLVRCVHIEQKESVGVKIIVCSCKAFGKILGGEQIVYTIQTAGHRTHRSVKFKGAHILLQPQNVVASVILQERFTKHIGTAVYTDHIVTACGKLKRHSACTAGKVKEKLGALCQVAIKASFKKVSPSDVINFGIELVVNTSNGFVALTPAHYRCAFLFSRSKTLT